MLSLEKKDALRDESALAAQVESVWVAALTASGLPAWLYPKVKKQVTRDKFMVDGAFDKASFTAAVIAEIADWEKESGQEVEGFGITIRDADGILKPDQLAVDTMVDRMLGYVNQTTH